ncbi:MAG: hypothetical protein INF43_04075 [Alphaproteobacteria bacterium]|jgi:hypothetical protein|nr:hypothetical protein [Alphaproteobacteria bacterium]
MVSPLTQTLVYTTTGRQRPVLLTGTTARFVLTVQPGDCGRVQTTCDPPAQIQHGTALWEDFAGGFEGGVSQVTALRVVLHHTAGWAQLVVQQEGNGDGTAH